MKKKTITQKPKFCKESAKKKEHALQVAKADSKLYGH